MRQQQQQVEIGVMREVAGVADEATATTGENFHWKRGCWCNMKKQQQQQVARGVRREVAGVILRINSNNRLR